MIRSPSKRVSLSLQAAKALREPYAEPWALEQLNRAIATVESPKRKAAKKSRAKATRTARETKNAETAAIYEAVRVRAGGFCECGCGCLFVPGDLEFKPELDHEAGRGKERQTVRNTWMLTARCHRMRHAGRPSRIDWLRAWANHCSLHGHSAELRKAESDLAAAELKAGLPFSVEREP